MSRPTLSAHCGASNTSFTTENEAEALLRAISPTANVAAPRTSFLFAGALERHSYSARRQREYVAKLRRQVEEETLASLDLSGTSGVSVAVRTLFLLSASDLNIFLLNFILI